MDPGNHGTFESPPPFTSGASGVHRDGIGDETCLGEALPVVAAHPCLDRELAQGLLLIEGNSKLDLPAVYGIGAPLDMTLLLAHAALLVVLQG